MLSVLRICIQKSGRLSDRSSALLRECGIRVSNGGKLKAEASNFPIEVLYLRDDDIPQYVADGVADCGILGLNVVEEKARKVEIAERLGFGKCRLSLAVRREETYTGLNWFEGKRIATSYPGILSRHLESNGIQAEVEEISGSVEIAPSIGLADGVCDIVSTGSTLLTNGLKEVETVMQSSAAIICNPAIPQDKREILDKLLFRIRAVQTARVNKYILLNAPNEAIPEISRILPGMKSPTVLPLQEPGWSSVHSVVLETEFWRVIDQLKTLGAQGILVCPIEKMVV